MVRKVVDETLGQGDGLGSGQLVLLHQVGAQWVHTEASPIAVKKVPRPSSVN